MQVLWLKTLINMLFTFGSAQGWDWHVWMHVLLAFSVALMVNQNPYISKLDHEIELFALLSLGAVAHVSSIFKAGVTWDPTYLGLTVGLFAIPMLTFVGGTLYYKRQAKITTKSMSQYMIGVDDDNDAMTDNTKTKNDEELRLVDESLDTEAAKTPDRVLPAYCKQDPPRGGARALVADGW